MTIVEIETCTPDEIELREAFFGWQERGAKSAWAALQAVVDKRLAVLQWQEITPENLPKVGDENGGWFGVFKPTWEVRPFAWPTESSYKLAETLICEALHVAGWTHFRPINPPIINPPKGTE